MKYKVMGLNLWFRHRRYTVSHNHCTATGESVEVEWLYLVLSYSPPMMWRACFLASLLMLGSVLSLSPVPWPSWVSSGAAISSLFASAIVSSKTQRLIHVNVWQKSLQYFKVISLQLIKINGKKKHRASLFTKNFHMLI